jgi:hypothetical protein
MIKYTLYLDASGDFGWRPPYGNSQSKFYVLAGLALTPEAEYKAKTELPNIVDKYFTSKPKELKYTYIISNKIEPFKSLDENQRKALSDDIFTLILEMSPILFATVVDKEKLKERYGDRAYDPKYLSLISTISRFSMMLKRNSDTGQVIMDDEHARKDKDLQKTIHKLRANDTIIRSRNYNPPSIERLERITNSILFSHSEASEGIQLADFIAKVVWIKYTHAKINRFMQIEKLFDHNEYRYFDPCLIPK